MAEIRYGGSGWAQIKHLEYGDHFSQGTIQGSVELQAFHLTDATTKTDYGCPYQPSTKLRAGGVNFYLDYSLHLDQTPGKESQTTSLTLDKDLPSFGWNLETPISWQALPEFTNPLVEEETYEIITPKQQIIGYMGGCGNVLITALTPEQQELIDESMWRAVRDMPKSIKDALIEDEERRSGKAFTAPKEPCSIWCSEMEEFHSKKGTTTKFIGPAGPKLIRITGGKPTEIEGAIDAKNENIYLINPHGILVTPDAKIR